MDAEMEYFEEDEEEYYVDYEFDFDYEFDAVRYFDFSRPESIEEAREAESWFQSAGSYPPSPFIIKLNGREEIAQENASHSPKSEKRTNMNLSRSGSGSDVGMGSEISIEDNIMKPRTKSVIRSFWPKSSTLTKPTASVLAKQNKLREVYSSRFKSRNQKPMSKISEKNTKNSLTIDSRETKRQKLETGYLRKVALLKHQSVFVHKVPKKSEHLDRASKKVTIPKEPDLETAHRALRYRRPKDNADPSQHTNSNASHFKARPLNRKILEAPLLPIPKRRIPKLPEFQVFHLKTAERALRHASDNVVDIRSSGTQSQNESVGSQRRNAINDAVETSNAVHNVKPQSLHKEFKLPTDQRIAHNIPIELFNNLTLASEVQPNKISQPKPLMLAKGSKENAPRYYHEEFGVMDIANERPLRFGGKTAHCAVDQKLPNIGSCLNVSRSLDIR